MFPAIIARSLSRNRFSIPDQFSFDFTVQIASARVIEYKTRTPHSFQKKNQRSAPCDPLHITRFIQLHRATNTISYAPALRRIHTIHIFSMLGARIRVIKITIKKIAVTIEYSQFSCGGFISLLLLKFAAITSWNYFSANAKLNIDRAIELAHTIAYTSYNDIHFIQWYTYIWCHSIPKSILNN